jgi:hypothetical protein
MACSEQFASLDSACVSMRTDDRPPSSYPRTHEKEEARLGNETDPFPSKSIKDRQPAAFPSLYQPPASSVLSSRPYRVFPPQATQSLSRFTLFLYQHTLSADTSQHSSPPFILTTATTNSNTNSHSQHALYSHRRRRPPLYLDDRPGRPHQPAEGHSRSLYYW